MDPVVIQFAAHGVVDVAKAIATVGQQLEAFEARSSRSAQSGAAKRVRTEKDATRETLKAHNQLAKDMEKLRVQGERHAERAAKTAARYAQQAAREEIREAERTSKELLRIAERTAQQRASILSRGARGAGRAAGRAMSLAGSIAGLGGGLFLADTARRELGDEKVAQQIMNIVTLGNKGVRPEGASLKTILGTAGQVAGETGISRDVITQAMFTYAANARGGNYQGMKENIGFFAKLANVTGGDINEIATGAAVLQGQNADLGDPAKMRAMLSTVYAQSAVGGTSFKNIVGQIGNITSARGYFAGDEAESQKKLLGLAQIAVTGGAAGDVGTYIRAMATQAGAHRHAKGHTPGLEQMGVEFTSEGQVKDVVQMVSKVFEYTKGDLSKIHEIFAKRGMEVFTELHKTFDEAGGGQKGAAAAVSAMNAVINAPGADIEKMSKETMETPAAKISAATERIRANLEEKMAPALERFANTISKPEVQAAIEKFIFSLESVVAWVTSHLGVSAGIAVGAKVAGSVVPMVAPTLIKALLRGGGGAAAAGVAGEVGSIGALGAGLAEVGGAAAAFAPAGIALAAGYATHFGMKAIDSHFADVAQRDYEHAAGFGLAGGFARSAEANAALWDKAKADKTERDSKDWSVSGQGPMGLLGIGEGGASPFALLHAKAKTPTENIASLVKTVTDLNTPFTTLTQRVTDMAYAADKASKALATIQGGVGGGVIPSPGGGDSLSHQPLGAPGAS